MRLKNSFAVVALTLVVLDIGMQNGLSVLVMQYADGSVKGHVRMQTIKDPDWGRTNAFGTEFSSVVIDSTDGTPYAGLGSLYALFEVFLQPDNPRHALQPWGVHARILLIDGGEPSRGADYQQLWLWVPDLIAPPGTLVPPGQQFWLFLEGPDPAPIPNGNVQIRLGK
jgi:hypothetical protein